MRQEIKTWELVHKNQPVTFRGTLLGSATSRKSEHNHPPDQPPVNTKDNPTAKPCAACFWTEIKIFRAAADDTVSNRPAYRYMVYQAGHSSIAGKSTFSRITHTDSYHEVLELIITRHAHQPPTLTATAGRAFSQATAYDEDLEHAWVSRKTP